MDLYPGDGGTAQVRHERLLPVIRATSRAAASWVCPVLPEEGGKLTARMSSVQIPLEWQATAATENKHCCRNEKYIGGAVGVSGHGTVLTIRAIATAPGFAVSGGGSATYTIAYPTAAIPTFSPAGGTKTSDQSVTISCTTANTSIYYTTDNSTPTANSTLYAGAISVTGDGTVETIKAIAIASGYAASSVASTTYSINYPPIGYSRLAPAPIGMTLPTQFDLIGDTFIADLTIISVVRGQQAWDLIHAANMFNNLPSSGFEYVLAKIRFQLNSSGPALDVQFDWYYFKAVSSQGVEMATAYVVEPDPTLMAVYPGGTTEGWVGLIVEISDSAPVLTFGTDRGSTTSRTWFKLYE